jgi:hypothetical protein
LAPSGKEESSFCEQKEAKKLYPWAPGSPNGEPGGCGRQKGKSLFASFSSEKEDSYPL